MGLRMIVFDVAGTVISDDDNAVAGRLCDALRAAGEDVTEAAVNPYMGMPKPLAIRELLSFSSTKKPSKEQVDSIHQDFQRRIIEHYQEAETVRSLDGAEELFESLRDRGIRVTFDTGFDRATLDTILTRLDWHDIVDDTVTSDEVESGRPSPDMIHALMERGNITHPGEIAKVGDSVSDIEQGLHAGCGLVVAVLSERTRPVIDQYPSVSSVSSLAEVLPLIDQMKVSER